MPGGTLTEKQQTFLDNYIRKHSILGRKKKGDAEDFKRRKGQVLDELNRLPDFPDVTKILKDMLAAADAQADDGNFKDAYHALKAAKKAARQTVAGYDPQPETGARRIALGAALAVDVGSDGRIEPALALVVNDRGQQNRVAGKPDREWLTGDGEREGLPRGR